MEDFNDMSSYVDVATVLNSKQDTRLQRITTE